MNNLCSFSQEFSFAAASYFLVHTQSHSGLCSPATHHFRLAANPNIPRYIARAISRIRGAQDCRQNHRPRKTNLSSQMRSDRKPDQRQHQHPWCGGDANFLDVHAFRPRLACFFSATSRASCSFLQFVSVKVHSTDGGVIIVFVVTVTNPTCFSALTASATFGVTVPTSGLASGRATQNPPSWPINAHWVPYIPPKFISPFLIWSARSSIPTSSAPAALAASSVRAPAKYGNANRTASTAAVQSRQ